MVNKAKLHRNNGVNKGNPPNKVKISRKKSQDAIEGILASRLKALKIQQKVESPPPSSRLDRHRKEMHRIVAGLVSWATAITVIQVLIPAPVDQWIMDKQVLLVHAKSVVARMNRTKGNVYGIVSSITGPVEYNAATMTIPVSGLYGGNTHYHCDTRQFSQYVFNIPSAGSRVPQVYCVPGMGIEWISGDRDDNLTLQDSTSPAPSSQVPRSAPAENTVLEEVNPRQE